MDAILITDMIIKYSRTFIKTRIAYLSKISIKARKRISTEYKTKQIRSVIALKTNHIFKGKYIQNNSLRLKVVSRYNLDASLNKCRF